MVAHVPPAKAMDAHSQGVFRRGGPIEFSAIITRIFNTLCLLHSSHLEQYIATPGGLITIIMIYRVHTVQVPLPCERL